MFTHLLCRAGIGTTAAVILFCAAILRGSAAVADPSQDDQFLASLDRYGIPALQNPPSLVALGHQVCGRLDGGMPVDGVVESMTNFAVKYDPNLLRQYPRDRLTRTFSRFVAAAVQVYCPLNQDKLAAFAANSAAGLNKPTHRASALTPSTVASERAWQYRLPTPSMAYTLAGRKPAPSAGLRMPYSLVGGVVVAGPCRGDRSGCNTLLVPLLETLPAGETIVPKPPQIPAPSPPPAHVLVPPRAPAPQRPPSLLQEPPPLPLEPPPPPPQEVPPPPQQEVPPPPEEPPPTQQVAPPAIAPLPGAGDGSAGGGAGSAGGGAGSGDGGGSRGRGPTRPSPTPLMPPGIIRVAP